MKGVLVGFENLCRQTLHSISDCWAAISDCVHQEVVASLLLAVLESGGFVGKMAHFFRLPLGTVREFLLQFGQIWAV